MSSPIQREVIALPHATIQLHWPSPRGRFFTAIAPEYTARGQAIFLPEQIHGTAVTRVDRQTKTELLSGVDGLVTTDPGATLAAGGADCQVLVATAPGVAGIMHAGWRGIRDGAAESLIESMIKTAPPKQHADLVEALQVWVSPSIGPCHYQFAADNPEAMSRIALFQAMFRPSVATKTAQESWQLDLRAAQALALTRAGLSPSQVNFDTRCTACAHEQFPSHRRDGQTRRGTLIVTTTLHE